MPIMLWFMRAFDGVLSADNSHAVDGIFAASLRVYTMKTESLPGSSCRFPPKPEGYEGRSPFFACRVFHSHRNPESVGGALTFTKTFNYLATRYSNEIKIRETVYLPNGKCAGAALPRGQVYPQAPLRGLERFSSASAPSIKQAY
jgi:hypothetical protein